MSTIDKQNLNDVYATHIILYQIVVHGLLSILKLRMYLKKK